MGKTAPPREHFGLHGNDFYKNGDTHQSYAVKQNEFWKQCIHAEESRLGSWREGDPPTDGVASQNRLWTQHVHKLDLSSVKHLPGPSGAAHARRLVH
jgi:hypothetical protein